MYSLTENKTIAVDVDGTLINAFGDVNAPVVEFCRCKKAQGFFLILWSARGKRHAEAQAARCGVVELFDAILSKPGLIIDDKGWSWTQYTKRVLDL
jgi:hydroxymethylpyrimidine pyrophosphatase-like HAD family hydrolase